MWHFTQKYVRMFLQNKIFSCTTLPLGHLTKLTIPQHHPINLCSHFVIQVFVLLSNTRFFFFFFLILQTFHFLLPLYILKKFHLGQQNKKLRFEGLLGWLSGKESTYQCRRHRRCRFNPWVGKISWRRTQQPTPVFLPKKSHGQRSLVGSSPWGCRVGRDWTRAHAQGRRSQQSCGWGISSPEGPTRVCYD